MLPCPKLLKLESGQGKEITLWVIDTFAKYNECKSKQISIVNALKNKDWKTFAKGYNGIKYAINNYDVKLANAYKKWSG